MMSIASHYRRKHCAKQLEQEFRINVTTLENCPSFHTQTSQPIVLHCDIDFSQSLSTGDQRNRSHAWITQDAQQFYVASVRLNEFTAEFNAVPGYQLESQYALLAVFV
jgi:hypothetical protein